MTDTLPLIFLCVGAALLVAAALHDVLARTLPDGLAGAVAVSGLFVQALQGDLFISLPAAFAVYVFGALCWHRGWLGGADVRLMAAAALLVPPSMVLSMLSATALAGGVVGLVFWAARRRIPIVHDAKPPGLLARAVRVERWRLRRGGPLPYAVAIACGALFTISHGGLL